jgi:hypothetical protein
MMSEIVIALESNAFKLKIVKGGPIYIGRYARWIFDNPERSNGLELQISTESLTWDDIAKAYTKVTGKKAEHKRVTLEEAVGLLENNDYRLGQDFDPQDPTLLSVKESFAGMFTVLSSGKMLDLIDYSFLDEILPDRLKSVEDWMRKTGYTGEHEIVTKIDWSRVPK